MTRILKVSLGSIYTWWDDPERKQKALDDQAERVALVTSIIPNLNVEAGAYATYDGLILTEDQYFQFLSAKIEFSKVDVVNLEIKDPYNVLEAKSTAIPSPDHAFNKVTHVHVAGQVLSTYNAVQLLEDACTNSLQSQLDKGWRIIAACTQPDQRRPDYILGRFEV